ncbi:DUF7927 domain-containing protein [Leucobacter sp. HY1908]
MHRVKQGQQGRKTIRQGVRKLSACLLGVALASSTLVGAAGAAAPAHAVMSDGPSAFTDRPGVAKSPTEVFLENFENIDKSGPIVPLVDYVSTNEFPAGTPLKYIAEGQWADPIANCNGFVTSANSDMGGTCQNNLPSQGGLKALADVLGQVNGAADPTQNAVVAAYTSGPAGAADLIQFGTEGELIPLTTPNRFMTFSVNAAAVSCYAAQPSMRFSVVVDGVETPISGADGINPCVDPRASVYAPSSDPANTSFYAGTFASGGSFITTGSPIGLIMRNGSGATAGNDGAFDDIRLLDVTPHLNKEFVDASVAVDDVSTLTFTITNTAELASKEGWTFTDTLREGLQFAQDPKAKSTCAADLSFPASNKFAVTKGTLAEGEASCTISVDVTSSTPKGSAASPKIYTNNVNDISDVIGLDATNETTVEFFSEPKLKVNKTNSAAKFPSVGDRIEFTVTAQNTGNGAFGDNQRDDALKNAVVIDDLTEVLDDAILDESSLKATVGGVEVGAPKWDPKSKMITWAGPLKADANVSTSDAPYAGESVVITYAVTLKGGGDGEILNTACVPVAVADGRPCASSTASLPALEVTKAANETAVSAVGDTVEYAVTVTNPGPGAWTDENPARVTDDLSQVLDDAKLDANSLSAEIDSEAVGAPIFSADTEELSWSGSLGAGKSVVLRYSVVYTGAGDQLLTNTACVPTDAVRSEVDTCDTVIVTGPRLTIDKSAEGSSEPLVAGSTVKYTLWFANTGNAPADIDYLDALSHVLDDADMTDEPTAVEGNLEAVRAGDKIMVTGSVPAGERYSVEYTVAIKADDNRGDDQLVNHLVPFSTTPPATVDTCDVAKATNDGISAETCNPVFTPAPALEVKKSAVGSSDPLRAGSTIEYTLTFKSVGNAPVGVNYTDHLLHVLDDAKIVVEPTALVGDLHVVRTGNTIGITGEVPNGKSYSITYEVKVRDEGARGDSIVANFLMPSDQAPPATVPTECETRETSDGVTAETCSPVESLTPPVDPKKPGDSKTPATPGSTPKSDSAVSLAATGGPLVGAATGLALLLLAAGLVVLRVRKGNAAN